MNFLTKFSSSAGLNNFYGWTIFPKDFEVEYSFVYGPDFPEHNRNDIEQVWEIAILKQYWESEAILDEDAILNSSLWYNPNLTIRLQKGNG